MPEGLLDTAMSSRRSRRPRPVGFSPRAGTGVEVHVRARGYCTRDRLSVSPTPFEPRFAAGLWCEEPPSRRVVFALSASPRTSTFGSVSVSPQLVCVGVSLPSLSGRAGAAWAAPACARQGGRKEHRA